jgi:hypothetical protein
MIERKAVHEQKRRPAAALGEVQTNVASLDERHDQCSLLPG